MLGFALGGGGGFSLFVFFFLFFFLTPKIYKRIVGFLVFDLGGGGVLPF